MRVHYCQHVPFENLGYIETWLKQNHHTINCSQLFNNAPLPNTNDFDALIIMGGPMGIYDEQSFPWLTAEKQLIQQAIQTDKIVLGICLGAQLIADVLSAKVYPNPDKEIGWFTIQQSLSAHQAKIATDLPQEILAFHWHGDTFDIPQQATRLYHSAACQNQAFIYNDKVLALQFHLETTPESAQALIKHCSDEIIESPTIQSSLTMLADEQRFTAINQAADHFLTHLFQ